MKVLERKVGELFRFRCGKCYSAFEMTGEEKRENDLKQDPPGGMNQLDWFDCPVCGRRQVPDRKTMHMFAIMDNGKQYMVY